ncbi:sensor histidine kinase [Agathobaculum desmolans]|uniref:sensor histidine kinase n=1 Tax=Agathobaculum desmolans TaxID=39484 RepID=UPI00248E874A|nr:HAMP domain-containing sensor histidine kinase [Agathobaculum desmolans]
MTKTLKRRFIIFTMIAVTCLLIFIVLAINSLNWVMLERQSDTVLETLVDADGAFHKMDFDRPPPFSRPLDMDRMRASRFFIVRSDLSGNIVDVNIDQISAIDQETAKSYALKVLKTDAVSGRVDGYKFVVKQMGLGQLIFFMDTSEQSESFRMVLFVSTAIAVLCWIMLLIIVILLSGKVIRPVLIGMEKQKQFITNAGHEMKTPLAIIQSNNDTMALIHGENKYNVHIRNQTKRLNVLMSNLLTLAKLDEEIPLPTEAVNISEVANELLPVYMEDAQARNLRFHVHIEPDIVIQTNKDSFRQMLTILLDNALKYTPDDGYIRLSLARDGRHVLIIEENTCDPSLEPDSERLFERFYRGDAARTQRKESSGYGIGLSAARAICENFGGKMTAEYSSAESIRFTARF